MSNVSHTMRLNSRFGRHNVIDIHEPAGILWVCAYLVCVFFLIYTVGASILG